MVCSPSVGLKRSAIKLMRVHPSADSISQANVVGEETPMVN